MHIVDTTVYATLDICSPDRPHPLHNISHQCLNILEYSCGLYPLRVRITENWGQVIIVIVDIVKIAVFVEVADIYQDVDGGTGTQIIK